jgi:fructose-bisphosphate aldolase class I
MAAWRGRDENLTGGQRAFYHRARCNSAAARGEYSDQMEAG